MAEDDEGYPIPGTMRRVALLLEHAEADGRTEAERGIFRAKADKLAEPWCMTGAQLLRTFEPPPAEVPLVSFSVTHAAGHTYTSGDDPWGGPEPDDPFGGDEEARMAAWNSAPPAGWQPRYPTTYHRMPWDDDPGAPPF